MFLFYFHLWTFFYVYKILDWLFPQLPIILKMLIPCLFAWIVSDEKSAVILILVPLYATCLFFFFDPVTSKISSLWFCKFDCALIIFCFLCLCFAELVESVGLQFLFLSLFFHSPSFLWGLQIHVQLAREQHGFLLCRSIYMRIFSNQMQIKNTVFMVCETPKYGGPTFYIYVQVTQGFLWCNCPMSSPYLLPR